MSGELRDDHGDVAEVLSLIKQLEAGEFQEEETSKIKNPVMNEELAEELDLAICIWL